MGSVMSAVPVLVCAYLMVCDGHLNDVIAPCGPRLCDYLCDSLTSCSSHAYQAESLVCVLRNRSQSDVRGVKECRNVTTRGGKHVSVCTAQVPVTMEPLITDHYGTTTNPGDAVQIYAEPSDMKAIYIGGRHLVMFDTYKLRATKQSSRSNVFFKLHIEAGRTTIFDPKERVKRAVNCIHKDISSFTQNDFISWCFNGQPYNEAKRNGFSISVG